MSVDVVDGVPEKLRIDRGPRPWQRHNAHRSWQNEFIHELSGLRVTPLEDLGRKIRASQDHIVVICGNANVISRRKQSRCRREYILRDLHRNFVVSAIGCEVTEQLLQTILRVRHWVPNPSHGEVLLPDKRPMIETVMRILEYQKRSSTPLFASHRPYH